MSRISKTEKVIKKVKIPLIIDFSDKKLDLSKLKHKDIKGLVKFNKLPISGNKQHLITRIRNHYCKIDFVVLLQKTIRGYFVRLSFKLRGRGFKDRTVCVNENDFYTLEPLIEIPFNRFFSYTDEKNFTYGFDIESLIYLHIKTGMINNPYNRVKINSKTVNNIFSLYGMTKLIFARFVELWFKTPREEKNTTRPVTRRGREIIEIPHVPNVSNILILLPVEQHTTYHINNLVLKLNQTIVTMGELRRLPLERRIIELFMEMDRLGQYTDSNWLLSLSELGLCIFFNDLFDSWQWRGDIRIALKRKIYPFGDPFINPGFIRGITDLNTCTTVMENLVYSGPDIEDRKIGALHVISALTSVSSEARMTYPWLSQY
jgi:hypothetical protein